MADKVNAYFSRLAPFYVLSADEVQDSEGFDAIPVEVDPIVLANVKSIRKLIVTMEKMFFDGSAPEEDAQEECDYFAEEVRKIFKTRKQLNV